VITIGQDDQAVSRALQTSNVPIPATELGQIAFERLAGLIAKNDQPVTTLLEPHLVRQGSANPPPG
jgi:DNA-binding LacI/PurR family transcriptional regulator